MEIYKWYKANEILPENTDFPKNPDGVEGFFIVALDNGDLSCANRWCDEWHNSWYWDTDNEFYDRMIERYGITHWMKVEKPLSE